MNVSNYDEALAYAAEHGISIRAVLGKVRLLGLPYTPKVYVEKLKVTKKESKADLVKQIEKLLATNFKGLDKLVLDDLVSLRNALQK